MEAHPAWDSLPAPLDPACLGTPPWAEMASLERITSMGVAGLPAVGKRPATWRGSPRGEGSRSYNLMGMHVSAAQITHLRTNNGPQDI